MAFEREVWPDPGNLRMKDKFLPHVGIWTQVGLLRLQCWVFIVCLFVCLFSQWSVKVLNKKIFVPIFPYSM